MRDRRGTEKVAFSFLIQQHLQNPIPSLRTLSEPAWGREGSKENSQVFVAYAGQVDSLNEVRPGKAKR